MTIEETWREQIRASLGEFPAAKRAAVRNRVSAFALRRIGDRRAGAAVCRLLRARGARRAATAKQAANWLTQDVLREMKERNSRSTTFPITADVLGTLLQRVVARKITVNSGRIVFAALLERSVDSRPPGVEAVDAIIAEKSLAITSGASELTPIIDAVLAANAKIVADVKGGKQQAIGALIGQVMKQTKGADPQVVREMLQNRIATL